MKRKAIMVAMVSLAVLTASYGLAQAHSGMAGGAGTEPGSGGMFIPGGDPAGLRIGMMGSGGGMMGSGGGMMGDSGWDQMGEGLRRLLGGQEDGSSNPWNNEHEVNRDQARRVVEYRLGDNPNLRIGSMNETKDGFEFDIVTKKGGELVDRLFVERNTGHTYSLYNR